MKKGFRAILGVTLLEVMLVLAIAAMIIVMSVRYYQSASTSQQANTLIGQITSIVAAADSLAQSTGNYSGATTTALQPLLPATIFTAPWGSTITLAPGTSTLGITIPGTPAGVCSLVRGKLTTNTHFTAPACGTSGTASMTVTYTANA